MGKLFGTDGVRGVAGKDLTCELALQIGRATAAELTSLDGHRPRILIGKDTRVSGDMLECTLAAGLCSVGADVDLLGVIPTPGLSGAQIRRRRRYCDLRISQPDGVQRHQDFQGRWLQAAR